jgi:hypothetical protein
VTLTTGVLQQRGGFTLNSKKCALLATALALPLSIGAAYAAKPVDPSKLAKVECSELKFSEAFLTRYPHAPAACLEARELNGKRYAKFSAKVYLTGPEITTVNLLNTKGDTVGHVQPEAGPGPEDQDQRQGHEVL